MNITSEMVKELRVKTGAGMMDCKEALAAGNGDFEKGIDYLRKKGMSAATKRRKVAGEPAAFTRPASCAAGGVRPSC